MSDGTIEYNKDYIDGIIKKKTVTRTTDSWGYVAVGDYGEKPFFIDFNSNNRGFTLIRLNDIYYAQVIQQSTGYSIVANTSVTFTYYYL